jgi:Flp pilus assembly protein TadD
VNPRLTGAVLAGLLVLLVAAAFGGTVGNGFVFDDGRYLVNNEDLQRGFNLDGAGWAVTTFHRGNWHPVTWLSHLADVSVFGLDPRGHHLVNVAIHAVNAVLVFLLLRSMTGAVGKSFLVAVLWAVHPLRVESVAWVSERKDLLAGLFGMLASLAWVGYVRRGMTRRYLLAVLLFALGLMSKPMLVTLPFVWLVLDGWPLGRMAGAGQVFDRGRAVRAVVEKVPFLVLAAASSAVTWVAQREAGAMSSVDILPVASRFMNGVVSYVRYVWLMIWPSGLAVLYPHPRSGIPAWQVVGAGIILIGASLFALRRGRQRPWLTAGWLIFLGMLIPVIGVVQVGVQAMADRYTYLPGLGIAVGVVWEAGAGLGKISRRRSPAVLLCAALVSALVVATCRYTGFWKDNLTLFRRAADVTRNNVIARRGLGAAYALRGMHREAAAEYSLAAGMTPDSPEVWKGLGTALANLGRTDEAAEALSAAVRLNPRYVEARANLGLALVNLGRGEEGLRQLREAWRLDGRTPEIAWNLGRAASAAGLREEAAAAFRAAVRLSPHYAEAWNDLGVVCNILGRRDEAREAFLAALRARPVYPDARYNLGLAWLARGDVAAAEGEYRALLGMDPDLAARFLPFLLATRGR